MSKRIAYVISLVLLVAFSRSELARADTWHEVRSDHFIVVGNVGGGATRRVARHLEQIRLVFQSALPRGREPERSLHVLAVANEGDLKELLPEFWARDDTIRPGGVFRVTGAGPRVALSVGTGGVAALETVYHEFFHYLASLNAPGLPAWLNEGLATYWAYTEIRDDKIIIGRPSSGYVHVLRRGPLTSIEEFLRSSPGSVSRRRVSLFYAQAWALTHYLLIDDRGAHRELLSRYIALVRGGEDVVVAARQAFGDLDELEKELRLYSRQKRFDVYHLPVDTRIDGAELVTRELPEADALAVRGRFIVDGGLPARGEPLLKKALEAEPEHALALEGLGVLAARRRDGEAAEAWFQKAAGSENASAFAHYRLGLLQIGEEQERSLFRATKLDPDLTPAWVALAYHYGNDESLGRSLFHARQALERDPDNAEYELLVARILGKMGDAEASLDGAARAARSAIWSNHGAASNGVCWYGSLAGFAEQVFAACEHAVQERPDDAGRRDSRGVARALLGDFAGAVEDFQSFVDDDRRSEEDRSLRRDWVRLLKEGKSPFDSETLSALLSAPF